MVISCMAKILRKKNYSFLWIRYSIPQNSYLVLLNYAFFILAQISGRILYNDFLIVDVIILDFLLNYYIRFMWEKDVSYSQYFGYDCKKLNLFQMTFIFLIVL